MWTGLALARTLAILAGGPEVRMSTAESIGAAPRESRDPVQLFLEHVPAAVAMFDRDMRYVAASRRYLSDYRLSPRDILGRSHYDVFPELPDRWKEVHRRCLAGAVECCEEDPFPRADGTLDWVRWEVRPWHNASGEIAGIILFSEIITERKRSEELLRESEERFRLLVQDVKDYAIYLLAPDGTVQSWNAGAEQMFGYREAEVVGRSRVVFFTEEQRAAGLPEHDLAIALRDGRFEEEDWRLRKDGIPFWANVLLTPLRDPAGRLRGFANVTRDFTDRRRFEVALRESEGRYRSLFDHMSAGLAYCRMLYDGDRPIDFVFLDVNAAYQRITGRRDVVGRNASEVFPGLQASDPRLFELYARVARSGVAARLELHVERLKHWLDVSVYSPARDHFVALLHIITDRKQAEEELRASEERLRLAQQVARVGTFEWDVRTGMNTWTPELEEMYGLPRGGFPGTELAWERLVHPDDRAEAVRRVNLAFETGGPTEGEWRVVWPDGNIRWLAARWKVFKDASGKPLRMTGINMDVTERKQAEEVRAREAAHREARERELAAERAVRAASEVWVKQLAQINERLTLSALAAQESGDREARARAEAELREQELEALFASLRDGVLVYGEDACIRKSNEAANAFFGADLRGVTMRDLIQRFEVRSLDEAPPAPGLVPLDRLPGHRALRGELVTGVRMRVRTQAGARTVLLSASPLERGGTTRGAVAVFSDVTDYEGAIDAARRASEHLRLSHDAIFVWHLREGIESWNRGAEALYGFDGDAARGRCPRELLSTRFPKPWEEVEAELVERRRWEGELVQRTRDGRDVTVSAKFQLLRDEDGIDRVLEVNRDITDRKRAEEALRRSEQELREADRRKDEFLALLSHELRNPLAPIRNSLYVLERAPPDGEQARRAKEIIERQAQQLTRLVADLLDVTRIARGKIPLQRERLDLRDVVRRTIEDQRSLFTARGLALRMDPPPHPLWTSGDAARLAQVLTNLLHNAAKFTPEGGEVAVTLRQERQTAVLTVRDTGDGIAPDLLSRIFDPFTQGEHRTSRAAGGLGLGLALVKGLVALHGGQVTASSAGVGKGAAFTITMPVDAGAMPAPRPELRVVRSRGRRVLVIDDDVDAAESLQVALQLQEHEVTLAFSGAEALEKARARVPDLVLCDIGLPGMDGYEVARTFRADDRLKDVPLVALTGYALPEDERKAAEAGFDRHLAKPAPLSALERLLAELSGRRAG